MKIAHGTMAWFEMVGRLVCEAADRAGLPPDLRWSLVERYRDGSTLPDGRLQGLRIEIQNGTPSFRIGVGPDERGDVTIEIRREVARELNLLYSADPAFAHARDRALRTGEMRVDGDLAPAAAWLEAAHDPIVDRTA